MISNNYCQRHKINSTFVYVLFLLMSCGLSNAQGEDLKQGNLPSRITAEVRIEDRLQSGQSIEVVLNVQPFATKKYFDNGEWWGALGEHDKPKYYISQFQVKYDGKEVPIPLSSFADLADPSDVFIKEKCEDGFKIGIRGGDASSSFNAFIHISHGLLTYRKVSSGEFPNQRFEETSYIYNFDPDM